MNQIMEHRGEEGMPPADWKRQSEEELGGTGLVWSRNEKHTGTPAQAARGEGEQLVSLSTATWTSRNQHNLTCWRTRRVAEHLGLVGLSLLVVKLVMDGLLDLTTKWRKELGGSQRLLQFIQFSISITLGINLGSPLRTHLSPGLMQCLNHKTNPVLFALP